MAGEKTNKQIHKKKEIKIFDETFIKNNKKYCKIIYNEKIYKLKEYFEDIDKKYKDEIGITLEINNNISNLSKMFNGCQFLKKYLMHQKGNVQIII